MSDDEKGAGDSPAAHELNAVRGVRYGELSHAIKYLELLGLSPRAAVDLRCVLQKFVNHCVSSAPLGSDYYGSNKEYYELLQPFISLMHWLDEGQVVLSQQTLESLVVKVKRLGAKKSTLRDLWKLTGKTKRWQKLRFKDSLQGKLSRLIELENSRQSALYTQDLAAARRGLGEVVGEVRAVLLEVESVIAPSSNCLKVIDAIAEQEIIRTFRKLPIYELARILDLSKNDARVAVRKLAHGGASGLWADGESVRLGLRYLHDELDSIQASEDHTRLDELVQSAGSIGIAVAMATVPASFAAVAVNESVPAELMKALVAALTIVGMERAFLLTKVRRRRINPYKCAAEAHRSLERELKAFSNLSLGGGTYMGELAVAHTRLIARTYAARKAILSIKWVHKTDYWQVLDSLDDHALGEVASDGHVDWHIASEVLHEFKIPKSPAVAKDEMNRELIDQWLDVVVNDSDINTLSESHSRSSMWSRFHKRRR